MSNTDKNNWMDQTYRAGRNVYSQVDEAIRTGDYSSLSRQINQSLNQALDCMHDALLGSDYRTGRQGAGANRAGQRQPGGTYAGAGTAYEQAQEKSRFNQGESAAFGSGVVRVKPDGAARVQSIIGGIGAAANALLAIIMLIPTAMIPRIFLPGAIFFAVASAIFYAVRRSGKKKVREIREARKIIKIAGGRDVVSMDEIASALGMTRGEAKKELRSILQDGNMSGTVYLDKDGTTLMLSKEAYRQNQTVMSQFRKRQREEQKTARADARASLRRHAAAEAAQEAASGAASGAGSGAGSCTGSGVYAEASLGGQPLKEYQKMQDQMKAREAHDRKLDDETQKILEEGYAFIGHIHQKNDEIPGEEISAKLDRLEKNVRSIFDQVRQNPDSAPDLHKLMSYYLPTTQKLVDTYAALDAQHVKGSNIDSAKREIEDSLDTINDAYEKLFDSFFRQTAWDVGSDVSVMKAMLQQDGLTDDEFQKMRKRESETAAAQQAAGAASAGAAAQRAAGTASAGAAAQQAAGTASGKKAAFGAGAAMAQAPAEQEEKK